MDRRSNSAIHSFTYTPDAGKTTAWLGNTADAFNQTWHALTSPEVLTGDDIFEIVHTKRSPVNNYSRM